MTQTAHLPKLHMLTDVGMHTWSPASNLLKIYILADLLASGMHLQDPDTPLYIRPVYCHLHTEYTRSATAAQKQTSRETYR